MSFELTASGEDPANILAEAIDKDENHCPNSHNMVKFSMEKLCSF